MFVEKEKGLTNPGPKKLSLMVQRRFGVSISTTVIYRFLKRRNLIQRPQKKLPWYTPLKEKVIPTQPGGVVQMDAKHVWVDNRRKYQRTFVDVFTGYHFAVVVDSMDSHDTVHAFTLAEKYFPFAILSVQSDNGSENRGDFHQYLGTRGITHYFIPKRSPQWNGAVERAHRSIDEEYYRNINRPWNTIREYNRWFNRERIHLGKYLNGLTPHEKYRQWQEVSPLGVN
jgi:transposase InsO family protein